MIKYFRISLAHNSLWISLLLGRGFSGCQKAGKRSLFLCSGWPLRWFCFICLRWKGRQGQSHTPARTASMHRSFKPQPGSLQHQLKALPRAFLDLSPSSPKEWMLEPDRSPDFRDHPTFCTTTQRLGHAALGWVSSQNALLPCDISPHPVCMLAPAITTTISSALQHLNPPPRPPSVKQDWRNWPSSQRRGSL